MQIDRKFKSLFLCILVMSAELVTAQVLNTKSPYSFAGLGELKFQGFQGQIAMGRTGMATRDKGTFSFTNPASYSALEFTDMEFSAGFQMVQQSSETQDGSYSKGSFDYLALGIPILPRKLGMTIGLIPYSNVGYSIVEDVMDDSMNVRYTYFGDGGINRIYLGLGYEVVRNLSLGVNAKYDFGNIRRTTDKRYVNSSDIYSFQDIDDVSYRGIGIDFGVQYSIQSKGKIQTVLGASVNLGSNLGSTTQRIFTTYNALGNFYIDTLINKTYPKVNLEVPMGYGLAIQTGNAEKWGLAVEYFTQAWSGFEDANGTTGFNDLVSYRAGGFFQLMSPTVERGSMGNMAFFLRTLRYSAGVRYENGYMSFNGQAIDEFGISFGLGIPMVKNYILSEGKLPVVSMINLTAEWIQRGTTENELIQEDILRISIGLNFNDKWFIKRKFQ